MPAGTAFPNCTGFSSESTIYSGTVQGFKNANTAVEHWKINTAGTIGRVRYHVWRLGYLMFWIRSPIGRLGMVGVPALLLGGFELWRIWRPANEDERGEPGPSGDEEDEDDPAAG